MSLCIKISTCPDGDFIECLVVVGVGILTIKYQNLSGSPVKVNYLRVRNHGAIEII